MLKTVTDFTAPFIQRTPEIGKARGAVILTMLFAETCFRSMPGVSNKAPFSALVLGLLKSVQTLACLGSTRFFKSYWVSLPLTPPILGIGTVCPGWVKEIEPGFRKQHQLKLSVINATFRMSNIVVKVVNSFAIGLLAQRTFSKNPGTARTIATAVTLALSAWNIYRGWNDTSPPTPPARRTQSL